MNKKIIYVNNMKKNLEYFMSFGKELTIMVKANAYGHSLEHIVPLLSKCDVKLGVATIDEAKKLRKIWTGKILVVEPIKSLKNLPENVEFCVEDFDVFVDVCKQNLQKKCYIKINSGMNRFGIKFDDSKLIKKFAKHAKKHGVKGLMTHFSYLDNKDLTQAQYNRFVKVKRFFNDNISVSFGGSNVCLYNFDYTELRVGIGFYGYENGCVQPIMKVKSQILRVIELNSGDEVGYSSGYVAAHKIKVAVVGLGYGDGIRRDLTGFYVYINGNKCQIIGNICMDCFFVDVTNIICHEGDEVLFERADVAAKHLKTISYEVLTSFSSLRGKFDIYE